MVLRKSNTRTQYRRMWAGKAKTIVLLKRGDDQKQGTVRALTLFDCKPDPRFTKTLEPIQADMPADVRRTWQIPVEELKRVGVEYLNAADRIVESTDDEGNNLPHARVWQPESTTNIMVSLFDNLFMIDCLRIDPPRST